MKPIKNVLWLLIVGASLFAQGKTSIDSDKQKVAIIPIDAVKIAESYGATQTVNWQLSGATWKSAPESPF
ncbi:MAG TPA: hypothetical protein PKJ64_07150, partial [bacterium]|nr:hypothetical protein [bacterium]